MVNGTAVNIIYFSKALMQSLTALLGPS